MAKYFKYHPTQVREDTGSLSDGAFRAYHVIYGMIVDHEAPIRLNERGISGVCNQSMRAFRKHLQELTQRGLIEIKDEMISSIRARESLEILRTNRENAGKGGIAKSKSLKSHAADLAPLHKTECPLDQTRLDQTQSLPVEPPYLKQPLPVGEGVAGGEISAPSPAPASAAATAPPKRSRAKKQPTLDLGDQTNITKFPGGTRFDPTTFKLTLPRGTYGLGKGLTEDEVRLEFETFVNYWVAKPGKDGRKEDWDATWRNWCIRAAKDRKRKPVPDPKLPSGFVPEKSQREIWQERLVQWQKNKFWSRTWGPEPGYGGCEMPTDLQQIVLKAM